MSNIICMFIDLLEAQPKVNKLFYKYQENITWEYKIYNSVHKKWFENIQN